MNRFIVALALILSTCAGPQVSAQDQSSTRIAMGRVEQILRHAGYEARGYALTGAPVVTVTRLPARITAAYLPGAIRLSDEQPSQCADVMLARVLAYDAAVKMLIDHRQLDRIDRLVERVAAADTAAWTCILRRSV